MRAARCCFHGGIMTLMGLGLLGMDVKLSAGQNLKESNRMQQELRVDLRARHTAGRVEFEYSLENTASQTILVFDRLWDMQTNTLKPDWAYVEIHESAATIKRAIEPLPKGLHIENPIVPYGREISPHSKASGRFSLGLPLTESGAYSGFLYPGAQQKPGAIREIRFEVGWCPKPVSLPPALHPVEMNGETLWLLPYGLVSMLQQIARSSPFQLDVPGLAFP
ncbi:MAG TPA: hypothetical protein VKX49_21620 [Bryobacteraceae bacterium]|nr:hypothetical protein [Bryobacteraceae bacterium]